MYLRYALTFCSCRALLYSNTWSLMAVSEQNVILNIESSVIDGGGMIESSEAGMHLNDIEHWFILVEMDGTDKSHNSVISQ